MIQCLIIADDYTGALDTGVQLVKRGASTRIYIASHGKVDLVSLTAAGIDAVVVDTETRHVSPAKAYAVSYRLSKLAKEAGVGCIFKKTDSALRGNIGAELQAVLDATGERILPFLPAFPRMGRLTLNGAQLINGVEVAESVFGKDPFEPVRFSYIPDIIAQQSELKSYVLGVGEQEIPQIQDPSVIIMDATNEKDMERAVGFLKKNDLLRIAAGCAGFGELLPGVLNILGKQAQVPALNPNFLVICGSVNKVTQEQIKFAQEHGFRRMTLTPEKTLDPGFLSSSEGEKLIREILETIGSSTCVIVDTNDLEGEQRSVDYALAQGLTLEDVRVRVADTLGKLTGILLERGCGHTMLLTGGDTLLGFVHNSGCKEITPICEAEGGTVLSRVYWGDQAHYLFSKSGGFGNEQLLCNIAEKLRVGAVQQS